MVGSEALLGAVRGAGLNLHGVVRAAEWDATQPEARRAAALLPGGRTFLVLASGGRALWDALVADLRRDPDGLRRERHPLDAFVRRAVAAADPLLGATPRRWFWAAAEADVHLDFRVLAALGGIGADSRLGLVLHPTYGPWIGLRAACLLAADLPVTPSVASSCAGCPAPCISACPGAAFPDGRWSVDACTTFHQVSTHCAQGCDARVACPVGAVHRYGPDELRYHYDRRSGRAALRDALGIPDDPFEGEGPHWGAWRGRVDVKGAK